MESACTTFRDDWLESAPGAPADPSTGEHLATCGECAAWAARRRDQIAALIELPRLPAPAELVARVQSTLAPADEAAPVEPRLESQLATLARHRAPSVLDRLVAEELADPEAAQARRFVGDLDRPAVPGVLGRRLEQAAGHAADHAAGPSDRPGVRRLSMRWAVATAAAAALVLIVSLQFAPKDAQQRSFTVTYGRPAQPNALGAGLADAWTGGMLRAGITEEGR